MDAQGRGRAGDVDPADQWVFNPDTGSYELRPEASAASGAATASPAAPGGGRRRATPPRQRGTGGRRRVPAQRATPDTEEAPTTGGRRARRAAAGGSGGRSRRKPKPPLSRKQKVLRITGGTLGFLLVAGCASAYWVIEHLNSNINSVDVGIDNDATSDGPVNILLLGTDTREGQGKGYGDAGSVGHADTTLLFHVSADRTNATVLSIPRDLITDVPDCPTVQEDGSKKVIPGERNVRFNTSLGQQGRDPGCTWRTVEKLTGVKINHFMMADFNAVKTLSTAVGGVEVCVAKDIDDPKSHLKLKAGRHTLKGEQALAFVRTRSSVGTGSDLSRIKLQQQFLGSMVRKIKSTDTLTNPKKLWNLADAATKALTVDDGIDSVRKLMDLAKNLKGVDAENVSFVTLPVVDNPAEEVPTTVVVDEAKAKPLFRMIQADKSLTETKKDKKGKGEKSKAPTEKAPADQVRVDVLNGGEVIGAAQQVVTWLQNTKGVPLSTNAGNAPKKQAKTTLEYGANQAAQAATLAEMMGLPDSALKEKSTNAGPSEPMELVLGGDFTSPGTPIAPPTKAPEGIDGMNAGDKNVCAE